MFRTVTKFNTRKLLSHDAGLAVYTKFCSLPWRILCTLLSLALNLAASECLAKIGVQPVYQDPFDIAAGGASVTRASKEARLFSNPALLSLGTGLHRWAGLTTNVLANKESLGTAQDMAQSAGGSKAGANEEFVDKVFADPVHVGWGATLAYLNAHFGLGAFSRFEPDIRAREFGDNGLPEVKLTSESYHGGVMSFAAKPWRWLLLGVSGKYLLAGENEVAVEASDTQAVAALGSQSLTQDFSNHNAGAGGDAGMLIFLQSSVFDLTLGGTVHDIGDTLLAGPLEEPKLIPQVVSGGIGITLHSANHALHLAADYRDALAATGSDEFKKLHAGAKLTVVSTVGFAAGLAAGYYEGSPSFGGEIDLVAMRVAFTSYTREMGDHAGVDPRRIVMGSLSMGY